MADGAALEKRWAAMPRGFKSHPLRGEVLEWPIRHAWRACVAQATAGSNPALSATIDSPSTEGPFPLSEQSGSSSTQFRQKSVDSLTIPTFPPTPRLSGRATTALLRQAAGETGVPARLCYNPRLVRHSVWKNWRIGWRSHGSTASGESDWVDSESTSAHLRGHGARPTGS